MNDEREHRRGLVLGLTLAEVLMLLLFLMMLALGSRLTELEKTKVNTRPELVTGALGNKGSASLNKGQSSSEISNGSAQSNSRATPQNYVELTKMVNKYGFDGDKIATLVSAINAAAIVDPNDPPAALRRALERERILGDDVASHERLIVAIEMATKIDPSDPANVLIKLMEIMDQLGDRASIDRMANIVSNYRNNPPEEFGKQDAAKHSHNWPPIITLSEADGHFFKSGSAELSNELKKTLTNVVIERLLEILSKHEVNVIEVIGHTDDQPLNANPSNLDSVLKSYVLGKAEVGLVNPADNAGLGLARAASVVRILRADERLKKYRVLPLSGAHLVTIGDALSKTDAHYVGLEKRRRIEIRVRRSDKDPLAAVPVPKHIEKLNTSTVLAKEEEKSVTKETSPKNSKWTPNVLTCSDRLVRFGC